MDSAQIVVTIVEALRAHVSQPATPGYLSWIYSFRALDFPTQAVVIQLGSPDVAFVFLTHIEGRPEMECNYIGPIPFSAALEQLPKAYEKFSEIDLPPLVDIESQKTLSEVMESTFIIFFAQMGSILSQVGAGQLLPSLSKTVAILIVPGPLQSQDPNVILESVKAQLSPTMGEHLGPRKFFREAEFERKICCARFVPPTRVGSPEPKSLQQRVMEDWWGNSPSELTDPVWETAYGAIPILVFASGMVVADTTEKPVGLQVINTFFAACSFAGQLCAPTTFYELGYLNVSPGGCISSWGGRAHVGREFGTSAGTFPPERLGRALRILGRVAGDEELALRLRLRHASGVHFLSGEYLQSFSLAWTTIELSLGQMWRSFLAGRQIRGTRLKQLTEGDQFTAFVVIEALNLCGQLSPERHSRLQRLRKIRNGVMHEGLEPSYQDAADCIQEANTFLALSVEGPSPSADDNRKPCT